MPTPTHHTAPGSSAGEPQAQFCGSGAAGGRKKPRRAIRVGNEKEIVLGSTPDDVDAPSPQATQGENDERLKREVPPHW